MEYCIAECKKDRRDKIAEIRANLIAVHNKYSHDPITTAGYVSLNLLEFCKDCDEKLDLFFDLALETEGFEEAMEGVAEEIVEEELDNLAERLSNAMKEV